MQKHPLSAKSVERDFGQYPIPVSFSGVPNVSHQFPSYGSFQGIVDDTNKQINLVKTTLLS